MKTISCFIFLIIFGSISYSQEIGSEGLAFKSVAFDELDSIPRSRVKEKHYWIDLGVGNYLAKSMNDGRSFSVGANISNGLTRFKARCIFNQETNAALISPNEESYELGLLAGVGISTTWMHCSILTGLGVIKGNTRTSYLYTELNYTRSYYSSMSYLTISVPLEVGILFLPTKYAAIGLSYYANFNSNNTINGISVNLAFGKIK